jgi:ABC-type dipeptide/oligopeptide/nickel transport system permease subunit
MATTAAISRRASQRFGLTLWMVRNVPASVTLALVVVAILLVLAAVGQSLWPVSANAQNLFLIAARPGLQHWLGTDTLGRDVFARIIAGSRSAVVGPLIIAASGLIVSSVLGVGAAYLGGAVDNVTLRFVDFMLALPGLLIAIVIVSLGGGGYWMAILVLSILNVQGDIRIVRGAALDQKSLPYIEAARTLGIPRSRIMFMHILPNISAILVADFALDFALALVALSGLAFLGLGAQPGTPEWGTMLSDNEAILFSNPLGSLAPGAAIVLLAVSVNLIGDWIFDRYAGRGRFVR